jgi:hypothetical protein
MLQLENEVMMRAVAETALAASLDEADLKAKASSTNW